MTILEAIAARHSVRSYQDKPIPAETADALALYASSLAGRNINEGRA